MDTKSIAFVALAKRQLEEFERPRKITQFMHYTQHQPSVMFVSMFDIHEKAMRLSADSRECSKYNDLSAYSIWAGSPGFLSRAWEASFKSGAQMQFSSGLYRLSTGLLLIEDIEQWCQHRKSVKDVRTCWDIIVETSKELSYLRPFAG